MPTGSVAHLCCPVRRFFMKVKAELHVTAKRTFSLKSLCDVQSCWPCELIEQLRPFVVPDLLEIFDPRRSHAYSRVTLLL